MLRGSIPTMKSSPSIAFINHLYSPALLFSFAKLVDRVTDLVAADFVLLAFFCPTCFVLLFGWNCATNLPSKFLLSIFQVLRKITRLSECVCLCVGMSRQRLQFLQIFQIQVFWPKFTGAAAFHWVPYLTGRKNNIRQTLQGLIT